MRFLFGPVFGSLALKHAVFKFNEVES